MNEIWVGNSQDLADDLPDGINCIITDPPYGMNGNWVNATAHDAIAGDDSFDLKHQEMDFVH